MARLRAVLEATSPGLLFGGTAAANASRLTTRPQAQQDRRFREAGAGALFFTSAGSDSANYIARWDGTTRYPVGLGVSFAVYALTVHRDELFVGGAFTTAGGKPAHGVAVWAE